MNIDRHNYEEWFLLYADDELSAAERREVEAFMERNPDLAGDLDIFRQLKLDPAEGPAFPGKATLYRREEEEVSEEDSLLISYLDGELDSASRSGIERRLAQEPRLAARLEEFRSTLLPEETVSFPDKASLYRKADRRAPIVSIRWIRVAVAAAIVISGGLFWVSQQSAVSSQQAMISQQSAVGSQQAESNEQQGNSQQAGSSQQAVSSEQPAGNPQLATAIQNPESRIQNHIVTIAPQQRNTDVSRNDVAVNNDNGQPITDNGQPTTDLQPKTNNLPITSSDVAVNTPEMTKDASVTEIVDKPSISTVTKADYATQALLNPDQKDEPVLEDGGRTRKGPFRGLVRKANRLFNKATNPDPDKATVKVASFEIALGR